MKKIIFYALLSFECIMVWALIYHAQLLQTTIFLGDLEFWRLFARNTSFILAIVFHSFLAYECFKKIKK